MYIPIRASGLEEIHSVRGMDLLMRCARLDQWKLAAGDIRLAKNSAGPAQGLGMAAGKWTWLTAVCKRIDVFTYHFPFTIYHVP